MGLGFKGLGFRVWGYRVWTAQGLGLKRLDCGQEHPTRPDQG